MITLFGISAFILGFLLHVAWWRLLPVRNSGVALITVLSIGIFIAAMIFILIFRGRPIAHEPVLLLHGIFLAFALALAYVMTYPAIEVPSPTLVIIEMVAKGHSAGIRRNSLYSTLADDFLVLPRIEDMLNENYARLVDERYELTPKGRLLARFFITSRAFLRLEKGG